MSNEPGVHAVLFIVLGLTTRYSMGQESCPALEQPPYVEFPVHCKNSPGERCYIGCQKGFELIGSCHRTCCSGGRWTGQPARCINRAIQCPPLEPPANGRFADECLNFAGNTCTFQCDDGVPLKGSPTANCLQEGMWSDPTPTCGDPPPDCFDINPPRNGAIRGTCSGARYGSVCYFECDQGYGIYGVSQIICSNKTWTNMAPTCDLVNCNAVISPPNGRAEGQCTPGILGQSCTIFCDPGYNPSTINPIITCTESGTWNFPIPFCDQIQCESKSMTIEHGQAQGACSPGFAMQICTYTCFDGFAIVGDSTLFCNGDGKWMGDTPTCTQILCPGYRAAPGANVALSGTCDPGNARSKCTFGCKSGYNLTGASEATCMDNGAWSAPLPTCQPLMCPEIQPPEYGSFVPDMCPMIISYDCKIQCNAGFVTIDGFNTVQIRCDETGNWTSPVPECLRVTCPPIAAPTDGMASDQCYSALSTETCIISCNRYYKLFQMDAYEVTCGSNGLWDPPTSDPFCERKICRSNRTLSVPFAVQSGYCGFGRAGAACIYTCVPGFALQGAPEMQCLDTGEWMGNPPSCIKVRCPPLKVPINGGAINTQGKLCAWQPGAVCTFNCTDDFEPDGDKQFTCDESGIWSPSDQPKCKEIAVTMCPNLLKPDNGELTGDCAPGIDQMICTYLCNSGYTLIGAPTSMCNIMTWDHKQPPVCRPTICDTQLAPSNGLAPTGQCVPGEFQKTCTFRCVDGYMLIGQSVLTCQQTLPNAVGSWSSVPPTCEKAKCPDLNPPQPGGALMGSCRPGRGGEICIFGCVRGTKINGRTNLLCQENGRWSEDVPTCVPDTGRDPRTDGPGDPGDPGVPGTNPTGVPGQSCAPVTVPRGGSMSGACNPGRSGRRCTIRCPRGYRGSTTARCQQNGRWTPRFPSCSRGGGRCPPRRRCCPPVTAPRFGRVMNCNLLVGGKCNVACNPGFRSNLRGSMTCMGNRSWMPNMTLLNCNHRQSRVRRIRLG